MSSHWFPIREHTLEHSHRLEEVEAVRLLEELLF